MAGAEDRQGPFEELLGFGGAAELQERGALYGEILGDEVMIGSERTLADSSARAAAVAAWSAWPRAWASPAMLCQSGAAAGSSGPHVVVISLKDSA